MASTVCIATDEDSQMHTYTHINNNSNIQFICIAPKSIVLLSGAVHKCTNSS